MNEQAGKKLIQIESLYDIDGVDTFLFDMYGVLWNGQDWYSGVKDVLQTLRAKGKRICILSNQTLVEETFIRLREQQGLVRGRDYDDVATSGALCLQEIKHGLFENITKKQDFRFYVVGKQNPALFEPIQQHETLVLKEADIVYIGAFGKEGGAVLDKEIQQLLHEAKAYQLPAVCANPDVFWIDGAERKLAQGAAGRFYEEIGGKVVWFGKPFKEIYEYALKVSGSSAERSIMIGDMLATDIRGANRAGMRSVLLTETGVTFYDLQTQNLLLDNFIEQQAKQNGCAVADLTPTYLLSRVK